ncbi:MAG: ATP-binding protein [Myxococcota bacterium]
MGSPADESLTLSDVVERRSYVTLLFADVCNYTQIIEKLDPEDADELRASVVELANRVVVSHGGQVNQFVGDGLLAVFGFPNPDEHAVRRALTSAIEFHRAVSELRWEAPALRNFSARIHSGVHSGLVFLRRGNPLAGQYELSGDAVNTAARLCSAAGRDEILVSDSTLHGLEPFFRVESVPPLQLKGKSHPVHASRVLGPATEDEAARSRRGQGSFVGRERELSVLEQLLGDCVHRRGSVICVLGDAGIGKSRLLHEFTRRTRQAGVRVCRGDCESYGDVVPLRPFLRVLREVLPIPKDVPAEQVILSVERALTQIDESLREHLTTLLGVLSVKPRENTLPDAEAKVIAAVSDLLFALGRQQPLVLLLDDWQWADDASVQVLGRLLRAVGELSMLIVVGARNVADDDAVLGSAARLSLTPFSESESLAAVEQLLAGRLSMRAALGIHQRSGGNPLFLEEICQSLPADIELGEELPEGEIPRNVRDLIQVRVERLGAVPAELLRVASVLGNEFPRWLLRAVAPNLDVDATLISLIIQGFLLEDETGETLRFRHGIAREVVYESVRVRERRRLHAEVARVLEANFVGIARVDHYEALASHHARAGEFAQALDFAELSGDKAAASSALDRARAQYEAALAHIAELPDSPELCARRFRVVSKWASACVFSPSRRQLAVLAETAELAEKANDAGALMRIEYAFGWLCYALGDQASSVSHLARALVLAQAAHDEVSEAQLYSNLGQSHAAAGNYDDALACLEKGIEMKRRRGRSSRGKVVPVGFAYALGCRGLVYGDRGEFDAAYVQVQEALHVVRDTGHAVEGSLLCLLGMIQLWQGRWHDAVQTAERGKRTAERVNGPYVLAICQVLSGYAEFLESRNEAALEQLDRALSWLERREIGLYLGFSYSHWAHALLLAGRFEAAREYAERAVSRVQISDPLGEAQGERTLAELCARDGNRSAALAHIERALASAQRRSSERDVALARLSLATVHRVFGEHAAVQAELTQAKLMFERLGMAHHQAEARRLLEAELSSA